MLSLRVAVPRERLSDITAILSSGDGIANVVDLGADLLSGDRVITAEVEPEAADALLKRLAAAGIATEDARLYELTETGAAGHPAKLVELADKDSLVWAAVEEQAHRVSTIRPSYIAYMVVAGIVAAIGILQKQSILIVGAMALSPDLGPVSAACVGVAGRNLRLLLKAALSLLAGLGSGAVGAACLTAAARGLGTLGDSFQLNEGGLGALATVNGWSAVVALAAGVAGMLLFETRGAALVGVAISVTTIPAASLVGVAGAVSSVPTARGALLVLAMNVALLVTAGALTLMAQRQLKARGLQ